jgi:hypothetical protein
MSGVNERIFVYLRVRADEQVLAKSKVRELRALGNLLADFLVEGSLGAMDHPPPPGASVAVEYVDAATDQPLVRFHADPETREFVVSGLIPAVYRDRMLGRGPAGVSVDRGQFERRAQGRLGDEGARELADRVFEKREVDLLGLIAKAIDAEGRFSVRVPMS